MFVWSVSKQTQKCLKNVIVLNLIQFENRYEECEFIKNMRIHVSNLVVTIT